MEDVRGGNRVRIPARHVSCVPYALPLFRVSAQWCGSAGQGGWAGRPRTTCGGVSTRAGACCCKLSLASRACTSYAYLHRLDTPAPLVTWPLRGPGGSGECTRAPARSGAQSAKPVRAGSGERMEAQKASDKPASQRGSQRASCAPRSRLVGLGGRALLRPGGQAGLRQCGVWLVLAARRGVGLGRLFGVGWRGSCG